MKIDQTLFSLLSSYVSLRGKVFRKLVITEMMHFLAFGWEYSKNFSMILKIFSRFLGNAFQFGELVSHYHEAGKILLDL